MNIACYVRVSTSQQVHFGDSLDGQKISALKWANDNGHNITHWYIDKGKSAYKNIKRPQFEKLITDIVNQNINIDGVLVFSLSRLARNLQEQLNMLKILETRNINIYSITETIPDEVSASFLMTSVIGIINEQQSEQNSKNVKHQLAETARKGYFTGGVIPFGYISVDVDGEQNKRRKRLEINPEEKILVEKTFKMYHSGLSGKPMGIKNITAWLNNNGIYYRNSRWTPNSINRILRNRCYTGEFIYVSTVDKNNPEEIIVPVPRIIEESVFNSVGETLEFRKPKNTAINKGPLSKSLLTGVLSCGQCGSQMSLSYGKSGKYKYYVCNSKKKYSPLSCNTPYLKKDYIDNIVLDILKKKIINEDNIDLCNQYIKSLVNANKSRTNSELLHLKNAYSTTEKSIVTLLDQIGAGNVEPSPTTKEFVRKKEKELSSIKRQIDKIKMMRSVPSMKFGQRDIKKFLYKVRAYIERVDEESMKQLIMHLITKIEVDTEKKKLAIECPNLAIIDLVSKTKMGTDFSVPIFVSMWRRDRDLKTIYTETYKNQSL
ncbi:recombinase family protein [Vibrio renipiscarius]|uniref:recombinase family protein n=1 Tax=Vibrio renipiscarius TaxID=1461322 RepID=UPI003552C422